MASRTLVLAMLAAIGPAGVLLAQDRSLPPVPQSLSLQEAVDLANQYSPVYRRSENGRPPAAWGVRNALASMFLPEFSVDGYVGYSGPGSQNFLTASFVQPSGTIFSQYSLGLSWSFSGNMLSQLGLKRAQLAAADADITGERMALRAAVAGQYLTVLEKQDDARLTEAQQQRADEALRLAQALYRVGQKPALDVRQADVQKGQADVALVAAAVRETFEEAGLMIGAPDPTPGRTVPEKWRHFFATGMAPDLSDITYVARAVTPPWRPIRFNARFLMIDARHVQGDLGGGTGELINLTFVPVPETQKLELALITTRGLEPGEDPARNPPPPRARRKRASRSAPPRPGWARSRPGWRAASHRASLRSSRSERSTPAQPRT